jgi:hypothetical protein
MDTMSGIYILIIMSMNFIYFCCFVPLGNLTTGLGVGSGGGWAGSSKPTTPMNGTPRAGSPINLGSSPQHRPSSWTPQVNNYQTFTSIHNCEKERKLESEGF